MRTNHTLKPVKAPFPFWVLAALHIAAVLSLLLLINHALGDESPRSAPQPPKDNAPPPKDQAETVRVGAGLFRDKCMKCHGKDGKGSDSKEDMPGIPDFSDVSWQKSRTNAQLSASILDGKGKQMPSFRDRLKADQVQALLAYIRAFGVSEPPAEPKPACDFDEQLRRLLEEIGSLKNQFYELHEKQKGRTKGSGVKQ